MLTRWYFRMRTLMCNYKAKHNTLKADNRLQGVRFKFLIVNLTFRYGNWIYQEMFAKRNVWYVFLSGITFFFNCSEAVWRILQIVDLVVFLDPMGNFKSIS